MAIFLFAAGVALIILVMVDALWTTMAVSGGGPLTAGISRGIWRLALRWHTGGRQGHRFLKVAGTLTLLVAIFVWVALLWGGWTLLFASDTASVVDSKSGMPASLWSRVYFTGYTLFTLGMGTYVPHGAAWEVATSVASLNGLFLVTLAITYLVPVISAAAQKHQIAGIVSDLGGTPQDILLQAWDGESFESLTQALTQLAPMIEMHVQRHLVYPVLHYFHSSDVRTSISPRLAALDEAHLILTSGVAPAVRLRTGTVCPVQAALSGLLEMLEEQYIDSAEEAPMAPSVDRLEEAGIPLANSGAFSRAVEARSDRRGMLCAYVANDGWRWDDVTRDSGVSSPHVLRAG